MYNIHVPTNVCEFLRRLKGHTYILLGLAGEDITAVAQEVVNPITPSGFENVELCSSLSQLLQLISNT